MKTTLRLAAITGWVIAATLLLTYLVGNQIIALPAVAVIVLRKLIELMVSVAPGIDHECGDAELLAIATGSFALVLGVTATAWLILRHGKTSSP